MTRGYRDNDCPVWLVEVTQFRTTEFYVAAETVTEAQQDGLRVAREEMGGWMVDPDYEATATSAGGITDRHVHESGGVWVESLRDWVQHLDHIPPLEPKPDPNQLALELHEKAVPHIQTVTVTSPGGVL